MIRILTIDGLRREYGLLPPYHSQRFIADALMFLCELSAARQKKKPPALGGATKRLKG